MHLILAGCEYAGTTTLAGAISEWAGRVIGGAFGFHDLSMSSDYVRLSGQGKCPSRPLS